MPTWLLWIIAAGLLAVAEAFSLDLVLIMLAGAALVGAGADAVGVPEPLQLVLAVIAGAVLLLFVRPLARRHLTPGVHATNADALVGKEAVVLAPVTYTSGRVRLNGGEWSARAAERAQNFAPGTTVQVVAIEGATAVVWYGPPD
ncbi:NfeD family protein [Jatrophihabitans telluris]|uniref:NfeD family protein n=1 Tax=Jatrophihabitans telluris TaxID=2038343 RepID=A0ABY4R2F8_9ACTN|nr:NfeD family protein [Jatrophihabitans telluris]UQX89905.1 NfeD family protein [Jatrophihabitans telluris]